MILSKRFIHPLAVSLTRIECRKPWADADSPRTKMMWEEYDRFDFPVSPEDGELMNKLCGTYLYVRKVVYNRSDMLNGLA